MAKQADEGGARSSRSSRRPGVGDVAPDFAFPTASGATAHLSDFRGKKAVVLYFYPKDNSSGCTAEACSFRDHYDVIGDLDAEVIGVSGDSERSHQQFAAQRQLPFPLVSDKGGSLRRRYGVRATFGLIPGRVTYVIDKQGVIRNVYTSQININQHISEALAALRQLEAQVGSN